MVGASITGQNMTLGGSHNTTDVSSYVQTYPPMADASDYEVQVQVNFETRQLRLLKVVGASEEADIYLFTREKCQPDCADEDCRVCRTRKLYQDKAGDPQGSVPFSPHQEYLYCLRFATQPITALLSLTPHEQDVEVKEKGILAYWFMKWLERSKILNAQGAVAGLQELQMALMDGGAAPTASSAPSLAPPLKEVQSLTMQTQKVQSLTMQPQEVESLTIQSQDRRASDPSSKMAAVGDQAKEGDEDEENSNPKSSVMYRSSLPGADGTTSDDCLHKQTSVYLPNMQVIYQVKKDQMTVVLPKPDLLKRPIDVILTSVDKNGNGKRQSISLLPGSVQSNNSLVALRNTAYTLQVQLHNKGRPVDLLDFITEHKILRVQESKDAPRQLNFLMERLIDQRGTFVLHITFDEKIVEVSTQPIGEFYLDVDVDSHRMMIGTIDSHASKFYRVEKISRQAGSNVLLADKQLIFEGGVDPKTLAIRESIPIERMSDYVITVVDPVTKHSLPTSVLAFHKHALFVKEIKNSDVRLHVTVQRQPSVTLQSSNANNLRSSASSPAFAIRRSDPEAAFHCPFRVGWSTFRIHHSTQGSWFESPTEMSPASTPQSTSTADTVSKMSVLCVNLDADLPAMKARLLSDDCPALNSALFIVYEESFDGKLRSTPCKMTQAFKIRHWCKYTVKCAEKTKLTPLLTFCVTDKEVTDIRPCSSTVRVGQRFVHDVA